MDAATWVHFLDGTCSPQERAALEAWLDEDPGRSRYLAELRRVWEAAGKRPVHADVEAAWARVKRRIRDPSDDPDGPPARRPPG